MTVGIHRGTDVKIQFIEYNGLSNIKITMICNNRAESYARSSDRPTTSACSGSYTI